MIGSHETVSLGAKEYKPVIIPFKEWLGSNLITETPNDTAKRLLQQCVYTVTLELRRRVLPVQLLKRNVRLSVVAETDLKAGDLMIPLFFRKSTSIVMEGEWGADHHKSIGLDVEWRECNSSERLEETGIAKPITQTVALFVKKEVRLPNLNDMSADWSGQEDLHPFWLIRRQKMAQMPSSS